MASNGKKELSLNKPTPFDGSRSKIRDFIQECQLYLTVNSDIYNDDPKKIGFILSYMSEKEATLWKRQYLQSITTNNVINFPKIDDFLKKVLGDFKQEDETRSATNQLERLQQGKGTAEELVTKFKLLVGKANLSSTSTSDHVHLIRMFQRALNPRLADRILYADVVPTTIEDWYKRAIQYDANFRMAQAITQRGQNPFINYNRNWRSEKPKDPNAMDVDRMTIEERNDLMKKGACFFCKEQGHRANECPKKKKNPNYTQKQKNRSDQKDAWRKGNVKKTFTDIRSFSLEERNELREMMISADFDEEESKVEEVKDEDF